MKLLPILLAVVLMAVCSHASAVPTRVVKERINSVPASWRLVSRSNAASTVELSFLLRQPNVDQLAATLEAVSDPASPRYGQHLTMDEVHAMVAPKSQHIDRLMAWLSESGINTDHATFTPNKDIIRVTMSVADAERLLDTQYHEYEHASRPTHVLRTQSYSLPVDIAEIVAVVGPTVRFPSDWTVMRAKETTPVESTTSNDPCDQGTTPACLKEMYQLGGYRASTNTTVAVTGFLEQYISSDDLSIFFSKFDPLDSRSVSIIGPNDPSQPGSEASLDIQYVAAMAPNVPATFWYTPGRMPGSPDNEPFLVFLQDLASAEQPPLVISTSYADNEDSVDIEYASRVDVEFMKLGVAGISMVFGSGDGGVAGAQTTPCTTFIPTYPAVSPYVTGVGGTTGHNPERAVYFSTGGFANNYARTKWQAQAVEQYLSSAPNLPPSDRYNASGRGFPDVATASTKYPIVVSQRTISVSGTSCASPTFAAIVSLLNDVRFKHGKKALGFLNPLLYSHPEVFTDITDGNNPGCDTNGFYATKGWDPITGLGTPNFPAMVQLVQSLP